VHILRLRPVKARDKIHADHFPNEKKDLNARNLVVIRENEADKLVRLDSALAFICGALMVSPIVALSLLFATGAALKEIVAQLFSSDPVERRKANERLGRAPDKKDKKKSCDDEEDENPALGIGLAGLALMPRIGFRSNFLGRGWLEYALLRRSFALQGGGKRRWGLRATNGLVPVVQAENMKPSVVIANAPELVA
jgi:hypothetical protein